jgi:hypothetical protein
VLAIITATRYQQAAESDTDHSSSAMAASNLANCYTSGWGTEVDLPEAARWLERAVALGEGHCAFDLGGRYEAARGVPRDLAKAFALYKFAAGLGNPRATFNVANCLRNGWGCDVNAEAAVLLYTLAAHNGVPQARGELIKMQMAANLHEQMQKAEAAEKLGRKYEFDRGALQRIQTDATAFDELSGKAVMFQGAAGIDVDGLINATGGVTPLGVAGARLCCFGGGLGCAGRVPRPLSFFEKIIPCFLCSQYLETLPKRWPRSPLRICTPTRC